jgi:hypothetical protein
LIEGDIGLRKDAVIDHVADSDEEVLVALGYKQEFRRSVLPSI